ncbi:proteasome accessory factor PafA2 family protein, partial [Patescibacteria group bacterium]|nr:proteasome accessory factor PafA2 family protein [Patescibacteria group bacterium]
SAKKQSDFYGNGARIYVDTGSHLEYATGEVMGAFEAVIHEKAGERIVESAVVNANEHPYFKERGFVLRSFKNNKDNNKDGQNYTYGSHENYCMLREKIHGRGGIANTMLRLLAPFRISSKLFAGNGWLEEENGRLEYRLSQRAEEMKESTGSTTTTSRPIINMRDEPHADEEQYYRLHLIDGDALLVEPALFLKFGATLLVLDMIESGFLTGKPFGNGDDFVKALHAFSADSTLRVAPNIGGKTYTIINIQEEYFKWANQFCETSGSTPEQRLVLKLGEEILTLAKKPEPHVLLAPYVDWAEKQLLMEREMEKWGYDWSTPSTTKLPEKIAGRAAEEDEAILLPEQIAAQKIKNPPTLFHVLKSMDFQFHENSPRGLARILEKREFSKRIVSDEEITRAITHPSNSTRALPRTLWNKKLLAEGKNPEQIEMNWKYVAYRASKLVMRFDNPYDTDPKFPVR